MISQNTETIDGGKKCAVVVEGNPCRVSRVVMKPFELSARHEVRGC